MQKVIVWIAPIWLQDSSLINLARWLICLNDLFGNLSLSDSVLQMDLKRFI